jgi:hypothetical protein
MEAGCTVEKPKPAPPVQIRSNLNETVFFFPGTAHRRRGQRCTEIHDERSAHPLETADVMPIPKNCSKGFSVKEVVTQKELMVLANAPRFLREGDEMEFSAKVSNLSQEAISAARLRSPCSTPHMAVSDAPVRTPNDDWSKISFTVLSGLSAPLSWKIKVPEDFSGAVTWQVFADGKKFRDGEESTVPVVSNRMLVTETLPITVRGGSDQKFCIRKPERPTGWKPSERANTLEFTSNPAWYAVQSLPYLMEFPHECSEQIFSRFYANTLASNVVRKKCLTSNGYTIAGKARDAMKSNLSKNQELKYALLEETPWVLDAQSEEQQKQNIALLFDLNRMSDERERALRILSERQLDSGGWAWFPGGQDSWYITQHIVGGFGHLKQLGAFDGSKTLKTAAQMLDRALGYCDAQNGRPVPRTRRTPCSKAKPNGKTITWTAW